MIATSAASSTTAKPRRSGATSTARRVSAHGSDASGTFGVLRYERGKRIEQVEWSFEQRKAADAHFAGLGLFPGCRVEASSLSPRLHLPRIAVLEE